MAHYNIFPYVFCTLRGGDIQGHRLQTANTLKEEGRTFKKKKDDKKNQEK